MQFMDNRRQKGLRTDAHHYGISKRYNYIFNSSNAGFINKDKNTIKINFTSTIDFPSDASGVQVGLHSANIVNDVPNIVTGLYDTITFVVDGITRTLTIPQGSYSACDLQIAINEALAAAYNPLTIDASITLIEIPGQQKLEIRFNNDNMQIDWGASNLGFILGFPDTGVEPTPIPGPAPYSIFGPNVAQFNWAITNYLVLAPELVGDGLPLNATGAGIVGAIPITAAPGSLIAYEARNILWVQCDFLVGSSISELTLKITNERLEPIQITEDWNTTIVIKVDY
jgi:hypothetical protein